MIGPIPASGVGRTARGTPLARERGRVRCHAAARAAAPGAYWRHRPETTALYEIVRDNLETLYGAIADGALAVRIPKHARKELEAYFDCGLLCRGKSVVNMKSKSGGADERWAPTMRVDMRTAHVLFTLNCPIAFTVAQRAPLRLNVRPTA